MVLLFTILHIRMLIVQQCSTCIKLLHKTRNTYPAVHGLSIVCYEGAIRRATSLYVCARTLLYPSRVRGVINYLRKLICNRRLAHVASLESGTKT